MVRPDPVVLGQESVWAYPRPAIAEACRRRIQVMHRGVSLADTGRSVRTLETSHPPSYYLPPGDVDMRLLRENGRRSFCEWKGEAVYYDVVVAGETIRNAGWRYPAPSPGFAMLTDHVAFYARPFEACLVDGELAVPQEGPFYGGWVSSHVAGPFKGGPGTGLW